MVWQPGVGGICSLVSMSALSSFRIVLTQKDAGA